MKPPSSSAPPAPAGYQQAGTMKVGGVDVPVYVESYQGEGQSLPRMALNPATGKVQAFFHDEVGTLIWAVDPLDPMDPSGE